MEIHQAIKQITEMIGTSWALNLLSVALKAC